MENKEFIKIVHASVLGDGYFYKVSQENAKQNTHYMLKQRDDHKDYIDFMANILEDLTSITVNHIPPYTDKRGYEIGGQYELKTMRHPLYKRMYNRMYRHEGNTHIKVIDPHYIKLLDWMSLAIIYMDDGWIKVQENKTKEPWVEVSIATHAFTYFENKFLRDYIAEKFEIHFDVKRHKQKNGEYRFYLGCNKDNAKRFIAGVSKYVVPSYEYKLAY